MTVPAQGPVAKVLCHHAANAPSSPHAAASGVKFAYSYVADENNIHRIAFDHRSGSPYNEYSYDNLDRLTGVTYHNSDSEAFVRDDLGNQFLLDAMNRMNTIQARRHGNETGAFI